MNVASRGPLGGVLGRLGGLLGRLGALLGRLGALLGALGAVLGRSGRPLGPSWAVGSPNRRECKNHLKTKGTSLICASGSPLEEPLGALLGRLGGLLGRLEAILGRLGAVSDPLGASWSPLGTLLDRLGRFWPREKSRDTPESAKKRPRAPRRSVNPGSGPLKEISRIRGI